MFTTEPRNPAEVLKKHLRKYGKGAISDVAVYRFARGYEFDEAVVSNLLHEARANYNAKHAQQGLEQKIKINPEGQ